MNQHDEPGDEDVDRLLRPTGDSSPDARLRQSILNRTTGVIRGRRRIRRLGVWLSMAACYVAGLVTMRLVAASQPATNLPVADAGRTVQVQAEADTSVQSEQELPHQQAEPVVATNELPHNLPGSILERLAEIAPDSDYRDLFRRAGDRYMQESCDLPAALRCYRQALTAASPESLVVTESDNWLIASLKQERLEEFRHANNGG